MATKMQNYGLTWRTPEGEGRASSVAYDKHSAEDRKRALEEHGARDVQVVEVAVGERPAAPK